jgi:SAM-dependent methyltransferase
MTFDRTEVLRREIVPGRSRALEIGPLDKPILPKPEYNVQYLDFAPTDVLRRKYADDPNVGEVGEVDILWNSSSPLVEAVGADQHFDAVVASHVIEHIPNPVQWLSHFASVLRPGGVVSLAVPDKRFTFDYNRRLSEFSDILDDHLRGAIVPSYAQLYDFHTKAIPADVTLIWAGLEDYADAVRPGDLHRQAFNSCVALHDGGPYVDVHCHTFTPGSFVCIIERLSEFNLIDFFIAELVPTQVNTVEFFVRLKRLDPDLPDDERAAQQQAGIALARRAIASGPAPAQRQSADPTHERAPEGSIWYTVSARERSLIDLKRRIFIALRQKISRRIG